MSVGKVASHQANSTPVVTPHTKSVAPKKTDAGSKTSTIVKPNAGSSQPAAKHHTQTVGTKINTKA